MNERKKLHAGAGRAERVAVWMVALAGMSFVGACGGASAVTESEELGSEASVVEAGAEEASTAEVSAVAEVAESDFTDEEIEAMLGGFAEADDMPEGPPCDAERPCEDGQVCDYSMHTTCEAATEGVCRVPVTGMCTMDWRPVCGCDGQTYGNDCARRGAWVARASVGECPGDEGAGGSDGDGALGE